MILGYKKNRGMEKLDIEPTLEFIEKYIGGSMDLIEIGDDISIFYNEYNVIDANGEPTLLIKYSDKKGFDYLSDVLIFGDVLFTGNDVLGGSIKLNSIQESFILDHLIDLYKLGYENISNFKDLKVLDLRA